jgi:hypothetical protein
VQESYEGTREHVNKIQDQMDKINETVVNIDETTIINIKHQFFIIMLDGKVINALTETKSTQSCYICGKNLKK